MKLYKGQIPFITEPDGSKIFLEYPQSYSRYPLEWVDNYVFEETLNYITYGRGRSSVTFTFQSYTTQNTYPMFLSNMDEILKQGLCTKELSGFWTFCKKGQNYGLVYLGSKYEEAKK